MAKEKRIIVDLGVKSKLLEIASYPTIRKALDGDISSPKKIKVREKAIEFGGIIIKNNIKS